MNPIKKSNRRKAAAKKRIRNHMLYAAGLGLIPIPIVDTASILTTQVLMLRSIAKIYGLPFKEQRAKSLIGVLAGNLGTTSVLKVIPGLGSVVGGAAMSLTAVAATYAIGKVFTLHFEQGGTLLDFDPVKSRKYFEQAYKEGEIKAAALKSKTKKELKQALQTTTSEKSPTTHGTVPKIDKEVLNRQTKLEIIRARRRKKLKAKRRRRRFFIRTLNLIVVLGLLFVLGNWFYTKYSSSFIDKDAAENTEIDLFMRENQAIRVELQPAEILDSLTVATIEGFSPVSTEGVIANYIQNAEAVYPKRYSLNAIRFVGSSTALSSGARDQLSNIAFLMRKYPNLMINIYGHTSNRGPKFNRQRVGRDRARALKDVFLAKGVPSFRITGNYIEKQAGINEDYWGAEVVLHVATIENIVEVKAPVIPQKKSFRDRFRRSKPKDEPPSPQQKIPNIEPPKKEKVIDTVNINRDTTNLEVDSIKDNPQISTNLSKKSDSSTTTQQVMKQYLETINMTYPKYFALGKVYFEGETTELNNRGTEQLVAIANVLQQYPKAKMAVYAFVAGQAGDIPEAEQQQFIAKWQKIGEDRAKAIKKVLHDNGIPNRRIKADAKLLNKGMEEPYWGAEMVIEGI